MFQSTKTQKSFPFWSNHSGSVVREYGIFFMLILLHLEYSASKKCHHRRETVNQTEHRICKMCLSGCFFCTVECINSHRVRISKKQCKIFSSCQEFNDVLEIFEIQLPISFVSLLCKCMGWLYQMNLAKGLLFLSTGDNYKCDIFSLKALTIQLQEPINKLPIRDVLTR